MNRRFVSFYYNRSGMGEGGDPAASEFCTGKTTNPYAFFAVFAPDGRLVGETPLPTDKQTVFAFLTKLLEDHPEYAKDSADERVVRARAKERSDDSQAVLEVALLDEELGAYDAATSALGRVAQSGSAAQRASALQALLRLTRYREQWQDNAAFEAALLELVNAHAELAAYRVDAAVERGYRLLAQKSFAEARALLQPLTRVAKSSKRLAEAHFYAGVACWFTNDRDWAKYHWCWVVEHLPEDRLQRRAYIAAAAEAMPYANWELGGYKADVGMIGTSAIDAGFRASMKVYRAMKPLAARSEWTAKREALAAAELPEGALLLVAELRDGNEFVPRNNQCLERLEALGEQAIPALLAAIGDADFPGRGYAALTLGHVIKASGSQDAEAHRVLRAAAAEENPYVRALAISGLQRASGR